MKRKPQSGKYWRAEQDYINTIASCHDYSSFNNDPECFKRYCNMQAKLAEKDGFEIIASTIKYVSHMTTSSVTSFINGEQIEMGAINDFHKIIRNIQSYLVKSQYSNFHIVIKIIDLNDKDKKILAEMI